MVHKTTVEVITNQKSRTFLPTCDCGWLGTATIIDSIPNISRRFRKDGRSSSTVQIKEHLISPYSYSRVSHDFKKAS